MTTLGPCQHSGCPRNGTHYAVIRIPALGASMQHALELVVGLEVCRDHLAPIDPVEFLTPESKARIRVALMERNKAMPDFKRAERSHGRVGDARWVSFKAAPPG